MMSQVLSSPVPFSRCWSERRGLSPPESNASDTALALETGLADAFAIGANCNRLASRSRKLPKGGA